MNHFNLAVAIVLTVAFSVVSFTEACANDFRSLLSELNFSKTTTNAQPLGIANSQSAATLRPVPSTDPAHSATLQAPVITRDRGPGDLTMSARSAIGQMKAASGQVAANSVGHLFGGHHHADSSCDCGSCDACDAMPMPRKPIRLPKLGCKPCCGSGGGEIIDAPCGCNSGCSKGCRLGLGKKHRHVEQKVCPPRTAVNLPASTLHQYFRSDRCNTNVWDGYTRECSDDHKHANGTCDCGTKKKRSCLTGLCGGRCGEVLPPRQACNDCDSCDAGCDSGCCR